MRTSVIVAALGLGLILLGASWQVVERWWAQHRAARPPEADRSVRDYMRRRRDELEQQARDEDTGRHVKPS